MVWLFGFLVLLNKLGMTIKGRRFGQKMVGSTNPRCMVHMACRNAERNHAGHVTQNCMAGPHLSPPGTKEAADMLMEHPDMKVEIPNEFILSTFSGKGDPNAKKNPKRWNPIFNYGVYKMDHRDPDSLKACYSSKKDL